MALAFKIHEKMSPGLWVLAAFLVSSANCRTWHVARSSSFSSVARTFSRNWDWWISAQAQISFQGSLSIPRLRFGFRGLFSTLWVPPIYTSRLLGLVTGSATFYFLYRLWGRAGRSRFANIFCSLLCLAYISRGESQHFTGSAAHFFHDFGLLFFHSDHSEHKNFPMAQWLAVPFGAGMSLTKGLAALQ